MLSKPCKCIFVSTMDTARVFIPILIPIVTKELQSHPQRDWVEIKEAHAATATAGSNCFLYGDRPKVHVLAISMWLLFLQLAIFPLFCRHVTYRDVLTDLSEENFSAPYPMRKLSDGWTWHPWLTSKIAAHYFESVCPRSGPYGLKWWVLPTQLSFTVECELL